MREPYMPQNRNYGIDLLRLLAMFMVVTQHVLLQGGVINNSYGAKNALSWLCYSFVFCSVDVFATISGYVCFKEKEVKFSYSKYLKFWLPVFVYSFGFTLLALIVKPSAFSVKELIFSAFPISNHTYWYASCYTALFFLMPWMNKAIRLCDKRQLTNLTLILVLLFAVYGTFAKLFSLGFNLSAGYDPLLLIILYFIGAWMKKCNIPEKIKSSYAVIGIICSVLIIWITKSFVPRVWDLRLDEFLYAYDSLTVILMAFCYIVIFSKIKFGNIQKKLIAFFSPAAFGVYLIHCQSVIWNGVFKDAFVWIIKQKIWLIPVFVLCSALAVFTVCLIIDRLRITLFKVLKIDNLLNKIIKKSDEKINALSKKSVFDKISD